MTWGAGEIYFRSRPAVLLMAPSVCPARVACRAPVPAPPDTDSCLQSCCFLLRSLWLPVPCSEPRGLRQTGDKPLLSQEALLPTLALAGRGFGWGPLASNLCVQEAGSGAGLTATMAHGMVPTVRVHGPSAQTGTQRQTESGSSGRCLPAVPSPGHGVLFGGSGGAGAGGKAESWSLHGALAAEGGKGGFCSPHAWQVAAPPRGRATC